MKVNLLGIDRESFTIHPHPVGEIECFLVQPVPFGTKWTKDNLIYRSSVWDSEGNPVSLSFKKFFNWDESPDIYPVPENLEGAKLIEKLDGSTLIFSRYKGNTVIRTRGTIDAYKQENGHEINHLLEKYSKFKENLEGQNTSNCSYIFEWLSPTNRIVLDYGDEPDMVLTGIIFHDEYKMMSQEGLDTIASQLGLRRPKKYSYNSIEEMKQSVEALRDMEGLCVYYGEDQSIRKVKSAHYLFLHRAKSEISSIDKIIDVYIDWVMETKKYDYVSFFNYLTQKFDFEIAAMAHGHADKITKAMKIVLEIMDELYECADDVRHLSRKDAAGKILKEHESTGRAAIVFKILDNKPIGGDEYKKVLYQVLG